jgi:general secretion pathway protein A
MYTDYYGLSDAPFQLTPDARFWFDSRTHKKAMAYLGYGLAQGEGFIAITGEIGAGKSTLAAHLLARIDRARLNAIEIVSTQVGADDVLRLVAQGLGIAPEGYSKAALIDTVEQALEEEYRAGKRTLIVVDEAQNLPPPALEELRMLSNFQLGGRALVQILLLGQPEFRDRIAEAGLEQLRQRIIATHHLEPMGADEIAAYVHHRLSLVGWTGRPDFDDAAFEALFRFTGGVPRRLNQLLNRLLLHAAVEELELIGEDAVDAVAADLAIAPPAAAEEAVLPLRAVARPTEASPQAQQPREPIRDNAHLRAADARIGQLESRLEEQEATLRRVLTLLVDWAERSHASAWDPRQERRAGRDRRIRAA